MTNTETHTDTVILKSTSPNGEPMEAVYLPSRGMNMIHFKKGNVEAIDQSTKSLFDERFAGLGALIGPHFHRRNPSIIPPVKNESTFPHIERLRAKGELFDPFSHGIGRYAPWTYEATENSITATLKGTDKWQDVELKELEGQNFTMAYKAVLSPAGLQIDISVVSDIDSVVGIHYYYQLPQGKGQVISRIKDYYIADQEKKSIPPEWNYNAVDHTLIYDLTQETDFTFYPFPDATQGEILLDTGDYRLRTRYQCASEENSWQLYHPKGASFVCIEPLSAQDPRHPNLTVSSLTIFIDIEL